MTTWGARATRQTFESWTDKDLFRAIELPENGEPGEAQEQEIAEYVEELRARKAGREAQQENETRLREKYQL